MLIYLDNAATTYPKPESVIRAMTESFRSYGANPGRSGYKMSIRTTEAIYKSREKIANLFGCDPTEVCFTYNCTNAVNYVLNGCLRSGDHLIISSLEHNAVARPAEKLKHMGVEISVADVDLHDDSVTLNNFKKCIRFNTKMIFCLAASNVIGIKLPISKIASLAQNNNLLFGVDFAQMSGSRDFDMKNDGIDFACLAPHKGLYAPTGTGVLIARKRLATVIEGGTGTNSIELRQPDDSPERYESGTPNTGGIIAISKGIDFVTGSIKRNSEQHEMNMIRHIYKTLHKADNILLYTDIPSDEKYVPVISFNIDGMSSEDVAARLAKFDIAVRAGLHCSPMAHYKIGTLNSGGTVRVSLSALTKPEEINRFLFVVDKIRHEKL